MINSVNNKIIINNNDAVSRKQLMRRYNLKSKTFRAVKTFSEL